MISLERVTRPIHRERNDRDPARTPTFGPLLLQGTVAVVLAIGGAVGLYLLLAWLLGVSPHLVGPGAAQPKLPLADQQKLLADLVKVALGLAAGIGAAFALVVSFRRARAEEAASHRDDRRLFSSRYQDAADLIGSDKAAVRLAGIYAMARLADDWTEQRQQCIDVLCAYLRLPYDPDPDSGDLGEREVRYSVIGLISSHLWSGAKPSWDGHNFDFSGAVFDGGSFRGASFADSIVSFRGAQFTGGTVEFTATNFTGATVDFEGARFSGGTVNFTAAGFQGTMENEGRVSFDAAQFSGATVNFKGALFAGYAYFHAAQFSGGTVTFNDAWFYDDECLVSFRTAQFSGGTVSFNDARFSGGAVVFNDAVFDGGTVDLSNAQFSGGNVRFSGARFAGGILTFRAAQLASGTIDLDHAEFSDGIFDLTETIPGPDSTTQLEFRPSASSAYSPRLPGWLASQL